VKTTLLLLSEGEPGYSSLLRSETCYGALDHNFTDARIEEEKQVPGELTVGMEFQIGASEKCKTP
jgi:hypothetical protein